MSSAYQLGLLAEWDEQMFLYHEDDAILIEFCDPNREPIELKVINPGTTFLFLIFFRTL